MNEAKRDLLFYAKFSNVSISPWWFTKLEQKYNELGKPTRLGPDYYSAETNSLFFDIDVVDKDGKNIDTAIKSKDKLYQWAIDHNYEREVAFTAGGYQMIIGCTVYPGIYQSVIDGLMKQFDLTIDTNFKLEMMRRVPGTYNFGKDGKSKRQLYCIDLTEDEVFKTFEEHKEIATKPRPKWITYGSQKYLPEGCYREKQKPQKLILRADLDFKQDASNILTKYGYEYTDICQPIRNLIEQTHVGHQDRVTIIKYLKSVLLMKYEDVVVLLPNLLTSKHGATNDGYHAIEEGQPFSVYSSDSTFNPNFLKEHGFCPYDCNNCTTFIKGMKNL